MVIVTEEAKRELAKLLQSPDVEAGEATFRLAAGREGQLGLVLDEEQEGDQVVEHEGTKVLLVGAAVAPLVDGVTLGCEETPEGPSFTLSRE
jgi:Fe-S cluster assembly iron-binding protein IscA